MKKEYSNGEVTVTWEPGACMHSKHCWQGLIQVFNPQNRPWINVEGASTQRIIDQVKKCPSGALNFYLNEVEQEESSSLQTKVSIRMSENGPLLMDGPLEIVRPDGSIEMKPDKVALCRCGHSSNKPFCDGSHKKNRFVG